MVVYIVTVNRKGNRGKTGGNLALKPSSSPNLCEDWLTKTNQRN